jgi:hypothetical protein
MGYDLFEFVGVVATIVQLIVLLYDTRGRRKRTSVSFKLRVSYKKRHAGAPKRKR